MDILQDDAVSVKSQSRITWGCKVATCLDRLKIGFYVQWDSPLFLESLDNAKIAAKESDDLHPVTFSEEGDLVFNCHATGRKGGFGYHLSRCDVNLFFSKRKDTNTPNVWVDIGSESCWSPGYVNVLFDIKRLITNQGGYIYKDTVSEAHLCADFIGLDIEEVPIDNFKLWITRANHFNNYQDRSGQLGVTISQDEGELPASDLLQTGIEFGRGDIMLRIYDKTKELKRSISKQQVFASAWDQPTFDHLPVTRVEYQLRRPVLKQMNINSFSELEENKASLWKYCTTEWTRLTFFEADRTNRHQDRAIIHPWWTQVQSIKNFGHGETIKREHKRSSKDTEPLKQMIAGCAMTIGTILERKVTDYEGVIAFGQGIMEAAIRALWNDKDDKGVSEFEKRMKKRWSEVWPLGFASLPV